MLLKSLILLAHVCTPYENLCCHESSAVSVKFSGSHTFGGNPPFLFVREIITEFKMFSL